MVGVNSTAAAGNRSAEIKTPAHENIKRQNRDAKAQQQAQHTAVISLTVSNTNKILREIGFRRALSSVSTAFPHPYFGNVGFVHR